MSLWRLLRGTGASTAFGSELASRAYLGFRNGPF